MRSAYPKLSQILRIISVVTLVGIILSLTVVHAQQAPIAVGENQVAQVSVGVPQEFLFTASAGQTVTIQALAITPGLAPTFAVLQPDAVLIENFENPFGQSNVSGVVTFAQAGAYVISVATRNGVAGEILLSVAEGGTPPPPPTPLTLDQQTEDILDPGASIVYSFDSPADVNTGLRLLYNSLDPARGLSAQLTTSDGRMLASASHELLQLQVAIPPSAPVSFLLMLTNDHPAAVTIRYALALTSVNQAAPTPTTVPATLVPLPSTGACVLATQGQFVNLRQGPSTSSPIITTIFPTVIYNVLGRNQDTTWYQIDVPGVGSGWVSAAVSRTGGDCSAVPVVAAPPTATTVPVVTATPTSESTSEVTDEPEVTESPEATATPEVTTEPTAEMTETTAP